MTNSLTTKQVAQMRGVLLRRVQAEIKQGHYPNAYKCACGQAWLIPDSDLDLTPIDRRKHRSKKIDMFP